MQTNTTRLGAYLALALSMALVGSYVALSKPLVGALPVFLLAWLRFGLGGLAMPHWLKAPPDELPMSAHTRKLVFLESLFGNFLFTLCMLFGIKLTSAVSAGVIMASLPVVIALMSWGFLGEKISPRMVLAIGLVALGTLLFSLAPPVVQNPLGGANEAAQDSYRVLKGNLLIFAAVLCEAIYAVIGKKLTSTLSPKRITALINAWGFVLMTPMGLFAAWSFNFASLSLDIWCLLIFYALAASVGTVWLWMTGLKNIPAAKAGIFTAMMPLTTAGVGVVFLNETMSVLQLLAFALCLLGVVLATLPGHELSQENKAL